MIDIDESVARKGANMKLLKCGGFLAVATAAFLSAAASASVNININQVGSDVVAISSGSLDLTGLTSTGAFFLSQYINPSVGYVGVGDDPLGMLGFSGMTGPASFGPGFITNSSTSTGDGFAINGSAFSSPYVFVPFGYVNDSPLSSNATWLGQSFASLGLTQGVYTWTSEFDSVTVTIGSAVPEPATWALMLVGFGAVGFAMRRKRAMPSGSLAKA